MQWILGNRERTQSASVSSESYERKLFEIIQSPKNENEVIFDRIEVIPPNQSLLENFKILNKL